MGELRKKVAQLLKTHGAEWKNLLKDHGEKPVGKVTVDQVFHGGRGIPFMLCDTSEVPADRGLLVRGQSIGDFANNLPEEVFYLLLTGELPTPAALQDLQQELRIRTQVPEYVWAVLDAMPADSHPMCMLNTAILVQQRESVFSRRYHEGMPKDEYWEATLDDGLNLVARIPVIAAAIYRKRFGKGPRVAPDLLLDWGANYAHMLGFDDRSGNFAKLMRLYLVLHCDHSGGNVSAMTAATVNSALSDLYYALSAGLNGLAGPLHGLANQECLQWVEDLMEKYRGVPSVEAITKFAAETIEAKRVIPGYGHAVLRVEDPRFTAFVKFGKEHCPNDPIFKTVLNVFQAVPAVLKQHPKIKNPWPNVDAASGAVLQHYGLKEHAYYTVLFSVSRALGIVSQAILSRGLGLAIIRPDSPTTEWIKRTVAQAK